MAGAAKWKQEINDDGDVVCDDVRVFVWGIDDERKSVLDTQKRNKVMDVREMWMKEESKNSKKKNTFQRGESKNREINWLQPGREMFNVLINDSRVSVYERKNERTFSKGSFEFPFKK